MRVTIYHNPHCSKSRRTLELLRTRGIEPEIIEYLKTPPTAAELDAILKQLMIEPRELMRSNEAVYAEQQLDNPALSRAQLLQAMIEHPPLIQRPIVIANGKARIGRPPETVLEIL